MELMAPEVGVMLCDWRGKVVWESDFCPKTGVGEFVWANLVKESQHQTQNAISRVVALRKNRKCDVLNRDGDYYRCWLWPLESPGVAVCILVMKIPTTIGQLTDREQECLQLLARGEETKDIARKLDVSQSTVHTYFKRCREKLKLDSIEALISFAARYYFPPAVPLVEEMENG